MEREEILRKSRNGKRDEGVLFAEMRGQQLGIVLFATVAGVLALFSIPRQDWKTVSVVMALVCIFHASISYGKYYYAGQRIQFAYMLISIIATAVFLAIFFAISLC